MGPKAQTALARILSVETAFTQFDYMDLARWWEGLVDLRPKELKELQIEQQLERHYTPLSLSMRLLAHLPLEWIRPERRVVFDSAAGSGSLLLAATRRLAAMRDLPDEPEERLRYVREHVVGNDKDPMARLIIAVKYHLSWADLANNSVTPQRIAQEDYTTQTKQSLIQHFGQRPTVYVANPPYFYGEEHSVTTFVERALEWMEDGDLFGFVLPKTFLHGDFRGIPRARQALFERARIFETWSLPERAVGLSAEQATVVLLGQIGGAQARPPTLARAVQSRRDVATRVRNDAFLGASRLQAGAPQGVPDTFPLGDLFTVFIGITPSPRYPPLPEPVDGITCYRYWLSGWSRGEIWANPEHADPNKRWIRAYRGDPTTLGVAQQREFLKEPEWANRARFGRHKLLVKRSTNVDSQDAMGVSLDTSGLFPNNDVFCIGSGLSEDDLFGYSSCHELSAAVDEWASFTPDERLLCLLGILRSNFAKRWTTSQRSRALSARTLRAFPLPKRVSPALISLMGAWVEACQRRQPIDEVATSRRLNALVDGLYGAEHSSAASADEDSMYAAWKAECAMPSIVVSGQVLAHTPTADVGEVRLSLNGLLDEDDEFELPLPPELPGWALDGQVFTAELSRDVDTIAKLRARPFALRNFRCSPRPYLTADELQFDEEGQPL